jgi:hypothetical protein
MRGVPLLAALAAALVAVPAAPAATRVVDPRTGPYTTITDALLAAGPGDTIDIHQAHYDEELWVDKDDITLRGAPGTIVSETSPFVVSLMGRNAVVEGLWIAGGPGGVRIEGDGARISGSTVTADTTAIAVKGPIATRIDRTLVRATALFGTALRTTGDARTVATTSILVGGREGVGVDATAPGAGGVALVQTTVAGAQTAVRGGPVRDANALLVDGLGSTLFARPEAIDFHLRENAVVDARFARGPDAADLPAPLTDFDGVPLGPSPQRGALQFVEHAPSATLSASATTVAQGAPVHFDASGSADPDPGGRVVAYTWVFGDGTVEETTSAPSVDHVFAVPGRPFVTVRAVDAVGGGTTSAKLAMTVTDALAPTLRVSVPGRHAQTRRGARGRRVVHVLKVRGTASDGGAGASGVASVDVTLTRGRARHASRAVLARGGTFSWHSPAKAKLARGRWTLTVRATDRAGNATPSVLHFTVT